MLEDMQSRFDSGAVGTGWTDLWPTKPFYSVSVSRSPILETVKGFWKVLRQCLEENSIAGFFFFLFMGHWKAFKSIQWLTLIVIKHARLHFFSPALASQTGTSVRQAGRCAGSFISYNTSRHLAQRSWLEMRRQALLLLRRREEWPVKRLFTRAVKTLNSAAWSAVWRWRAAAHTGTGLKERHEKERLDGRTEEERREKGFYGQKCH